MRNAAWPPATQHPSSQNEQQCWHAGIAAASVGRTAATLFGWRNAITVKAVAVIAASEPVGTEFSIGYRASIGARAVFTHILGAVGVGRATSAKRTRHDAIVVTDVAERWHVGARHVVGTASAAGLGAEFYPRIAGPVRTLAGYALAIGMAQLP